MRAVLLGCLAMSAMLAPPARARNPDVEAPVHIFAEAFNKGDIATAKTTMAAEGSITDEFAPFLWTGPNAFDDWSASFGVDAKARGITEPAVAIGNATRVVSSNAKAYVVVPAVYNFKQKGIAMRESAQMTFAMTKAGDAWKIAGWTWTGPDPVPVK